MQIFYSIVLGNAADTANGYPYVEKDVNRNLCLNLNLE